MCENPGKIDMVAAMAGNSQTRNSLKSEQVSDLLKSWEKHTHLRLGQFIVNALGLSCPELYYVSNEELLAKLSLYPQDPPIPPGLINQ